MDYPQTQRVDVVDELFGHRIPDPYRWLEEAAAPDTREWTAEQNRLTRAHLDSLPGRDLLRKRLTDLLDAGMVSAPAWRGERAFFMRRNPGAEHPVLICSERGEERVLIDPTQIDPELLTTLDSWQPTIDGRLLAYQLSHGGTEESSLSVMDVTTGEDIEGPTDRTRYSPVAWLPSGDAFFYVRRLPPDAVPAGQEQYHRRVYLHRLGTDPSEDVLIFGEGRDMTEYYGVYVSRDGRWFVVSASQGTAPRNDVWVADLQASPPDAPDLQPLQVGVDAQTDVYVRDGRMYILTDRDAPRRRLCVCDPTDFAYESWRDLVAEDPEGVLDDYAILDEVLLVAHTRHAVAELAAHDLQSGSLRTSLELPGLGTLLGVTSRPEGGSEAWFGYTDHVTPPCAYSYDAGTGAIELWAAPPGQAEFQRPHVELVTYQSKDGTTVRMFVLSPDGKPSARPAILYGYGGFDVPMTPGYSAQTLTWVENGGVYAVACIRGGSEEGEDWHRAGMRENKQNVFDDFAAAAEWLVHHGWTTYDRLAIAGGSNGGLLVGAALTQHPDLFAAVVCSAPLLDMVRYEQFGLGATWNDEYGTASDPKQLEWLLSYSPYHNVVEETAYPAVLFTVFDSDTRVDPLHARKLCAALQHATTDDAPILLRTEVDVGHGQRAVSRTIDEAVDTLAFLAAHTGLAL